MQRIFLWIMLAILMTACNQPAGNQDEGLAIKSEKIVSATIEELVATPAEYQDREVAVTGMVTHVCRHGGQKCFALAGDGKTQIRIVPSGDIDEFSIDLEGSTVAFKGIFRVMNQIEAEANVEDYGSQATHMTEQAHSEAEKADIYIEAVDFKEISK
jgi:hypothetical protein